MATRTVLIAYDGSEPAGNAIDQAAQLFSGRPALVVTVWGSVRDASPAARIALPQDVIDEAVRKLDAAAETHAQELAERGAARARLAGLDAGAVTRRADRSVWATILTLGEEEAVAAVVVGARGVSGLRSAVLGSVSNGVVHHSRRPVVVVHPPQFAVERRVCSCWERWLPRKRGRRRERKPPISGVLEACADGHAGRGALAVGRCPRSRGVPFDDGAGRRALPRGWTCAWTVASSTPR